MISCWHGGAVPYNVTQYDTMVSGGNLSASGFLNTNTAPHQHPQMANYGLMDQVNISYFSRHLIPLNTKHLTFILIRSRLSNGSSRTSSALGATRRGWPCLVTAREQLASTSSCSLLQPWQVQHPVIQTDHTIKKLLKEFICDLKLPIKGQEGIKENGMANCAQNGRSSQVFVAPFEKRLDWSWLY